VLLVAAAPSTYLDFLRGNVAYAKLKN
jgi:hypothetical protein